jgi:hypothetical protein
MSLSTTKPQSPARSQAAGDRGNSKSAAVVGAKASPEARRLATVILEVLAGLRSPAEAAKACGLSLPSYYSCELRALHGLLAACEPRPRGRQVCAASQVAQLQRECQRLRRQCDRQQAVIRLAQRSIGLAPTTATPAPVARGKQTGKKRQRRPRARALRLIEQLQQAPEQSGIAPPVEQSGTSCQKDTNLT